MVSPSSVTPAAVMVTVPALSEVNAAFLPEPIKDGVLGHFDTTMLMNGQYDVKLTVQGILVQAPVSPE